MTALQTKCQKLAEPTILHEMTDRKINTLYNVCSVPWGDMMHVGDILSTMGDIQYNGGIS